MKVDLYVLTRVDGRVLAVKASADAAKEEAARLLSDGDMVWKGGVGVLEGWVWGQRRFWIEEATVDLELTTEHLSPRDAYDSREHGLVTHERVVRIEGDEVLREPA